MKLTITIIRGLINDILIFFSMFVLGIIGLPFSIISKKWAYKFIKLYCLSCFLILRVISNIRVECRGKIPTNNVLICSKHMSFLDIIMLAYFLPEFSFVMKKEIVFTPIIGINNLFGSFRFISGNMNVYWGPSCFYIFPPTHRLKLL